MLQCSAATAADYPDVCTSCYKFYKLRVKERMEEGRRFSCERICEKDWSRKSASTFSCIQLVFFYTRLFKILCLDYIECHLAVRVLIRAVSDHGDVQVLAELLGT